ncbi:hypothetical protein BJX65DRAFT_261331 [Aspergillus insuetus]
MNHVVPSHVIWGIESGFLIFRNSIQMLQVGEYATGVFIYLTSLPVMYRPTSVKRLMEILKYK